MKRLTIVTSSYKASQYLRGYFNGMLGIDNPEQLQVILVQNLPDQVERQIADEYQRRYPDLFRIIQLDFLETIGASTNRGFALANTPYVAYQDVDDIRVPDSYERQMATLESHPDIDFTYGDFIKVHAQGEHEGQYMDRPEFDRSLFTRKCLTGPTHLFRIGLLKTIGGWDEQFRSAGDFDFQARAALNCEFKKTPGLLLYYTSYQGSGSVSSGILQPIERTVIDLRYGTFDRIDYRYFKYTKKYKTNEMLFRGKWHPLNDYTPGYTNFIQDKEPLRPVELRNSMVGQIARYVLSAKQTIKGLLRL
jgi:glycosyltransferase involved in cell wall biosynthesis